MNDRRRGALIGLAVGDALGAVVEFQPPGSFAPVTGYRNGGPHRLNAGGCTDDTSMALADSIASVGWDLNDQASRYVEWWKTGKYSVNGRCFDIGITTRSALIAIQESVMLPRPRSTFRRSIGMIRCATVLDRDRCGRRPAQPGHFPAATRAACATGDSRSWPVPRE